MTESDDLIARVFIHTFLSQWIHAVVHSQAMKRKAKRELNGSLEVFAYNRAT